MLNYQRLCFLLALEARAAVLKRWPDGDLALLADAWGGEAAAHLQALDGLGGVW